MTPTTVPVMKRDASMGTIQNRRSNMDIEFPNGQVIIIPDSQRDRIEDEKRERKLKEQRTADHISITIKEAQK